MNEINEKKENKLKERKKEEWKKKFHRMKWKGRMKRKSISTNKSKRE